MPQSLVIGNGNLCANFDENLQMRDFYYPFVGEENHTPYGKMHRMGVYADHRFSWLYDGSWDQTVEYHEDTLVGNCFSENSKFNIRLRFEDFVYTTHDILFRKVTVENKASYERKIKLFFAHDFYLYGDKIQDTAQYEPELNAILNYRKKRYFLINGRWDQSEKGMDQYAIGKSGYRGKEGTWKDAEDDGVLQKNPIEQGSVDSVAGFEEIFKPGEKKTLWVWVAAGQKYGDIIKNNNRVFELGPQKIYDHTFHFWREWTRVNDKKFCNSCLDPEVIRLLKRSFLMVRTQIDNRGAIIASADSDIMMFNKDSYAYMWPRDGAFIAMAMTKAGYNEVVRNFLFFCRNLITEEGYLMKKYTPEGAVGSSWLPKIKNGKIQLPIQEDESALVLLALDKFYKHSRSVDAVQNLFNSMVLPIGKFLMRYTDQKTNLPIPSYGLWEEQRGIFTYTSSCVYAGLKSAAHLSKITGHNESAEMFNAQAEKLQKAILKYLYSKKSGRFLKKILMENGKISEEDNTVDASLAFIWKMGVLPPDDKKVVATMRAIEEKLTVQTEVGGIARYEYDYYQKPPEIRLSDSVPGNPWIITTLWLANWYITMAKSPADLEKPKRILEWVTRQQNSAGILPEQMHPHTGVPLSVAPLTWSHSTFIDTVLQFEKKTQKLKK